MMMAEIFGYAYTQNKAMYSCYSDSVEMFSLDTKFF